MTGFGVGRAQSGDEELTVELKSVNHKFCEVKVRLPRELAMLEASLLKTVKDRLARGAIDLTVKRQGATTTAQVPQVDLALAAEYRRVIAEVAGHFGLPEGFSARDLTLLPGVMRLEEKGVDLAAATLAAGPALETALRGLLQMRELEGEALRADLEHRLGLVAALSKEVAELAPRAVEELKKRLEERIAELSHGIAVEPQRLAQEVAFQAERADVAEEMTRLASHLDQFQGLIQSPEPAGRKMDFLVQEMHREVNTTGSKSQHPEISRRIVTLKAELERIREQVQNIE